MFQVLCARPCSRRDLLKAAVALLATGGASLSAACTAQLTPTPSPSAIATNPPPASPEAARTAAPAATPAPAAFKEATIKVSHLYGTDHPAHLGLLKFKEDVEGKTGGMVKIQIYPAGQLAQNENELVQGVRLSIATMCLVSAGGMSPFLPDFQVMGLPYIWRDGEHLKKVARGPIGASLADQAAEKIGVRVLDGARLLGPRHLTTGSKVAKLPADLQGLRISVPEVPIYLETIRAMGGRPVAVAAAEVYSVLSSQAADGQENLATGIEAGRLYEVQKQLMLTGHILQTNLLAVGEGFWKEAGADLQTVLREAAWESGDRETALAASRNQEALDRLRAQGMEIHEVDRDAFKRATATVARKFTDQWTPGLVEKIAG